jgi:hypothetical protein
MSLFSGRDTVTRFLPQFLDSGMIFGVRSAADTLTCFWSISQSDQPHLFSFSPGDDRDR